jgi:hypothetical protein
MAERDTRGAIKDTDKAAPQPRARSFAPLSATEIAAAAKAAEKKPEKARKRPPPREIPAARVDPGLVRQLEQEIEQKVKSGRSRMRWFANHLILFVAGVAAAVPLKLSAFPDMPNAYLYLPFGAWVGLLAIHLNYAMIPILRRSKAEAQLKALVPSSDKDTDEDEFDSDKR